MSPAHDEPEAQPHDQLPSQPHQLAGHVILTGDAGLCALVLDQLSTVMDAAAAQNIVDLGMVNSVHAEPGTIEVVLLTACPTCPLGNRVLDDAFVAIRAVAPADTDIFVLPASQQTWTPLRMSVDGRRRLGWK